MKAVILAGGEGRRLRPLTNDKPKSLLVVGGKPIIDWQIEWMKSYGVDSFVVSAGYMKDALIGYLGTGARLGIELSFVVENEPLGTGGAIKNAVSALGGTEKFIVANGDIITNLDLKELIASCKDVASVSLSPLKSTFGILDTDGDKVIGFREKPVLKEYWLNAGIYVMSKEVFGYLPDKGSLEYDVFPQLAKKGLLDCMKYGDSYWRSVDTMKDFEEVGVDLNNNLVYE
ncbi:MAG: nucleotidyltransferase family protein [Candidatus Micrarchaeaceae archaeon]|jgi:NDP-sugar pyrophosphorylase family protein|nr:nucleotidyltransferase family protein [Candidatus Micrarchaeota archaeon]